MDGGVELNFRRRAGLILDFGGGYGNRWMEPGAYQPFRTPPGAVRQHSVLPGPEIQSSAGDRNLSPERWAAGSITGLTAGFLSGCSSPILSWFRWAI
jgi:hypothetical protein